MKIIIKHYLLSIVAIIWAAMFLFIVLAPFWFLYRLIGMVI